jgi:MerR family mercuric resistance operon transcriptional regulator
MNVSMNAAKRKSITIQIAAKKAGIGIETIRYYQRIGLIKKPEKPLSGYRVYSKETITRLLFIQRAKELGFSLAEISNLLALGDGRCSETRELAEHKLELIKSKLYDLQAIAKTLETLIQSCESNSAHQECPIINAILTK